jgi:hypothetical protein
MRSLLIGFAGVSPKSAVPNLVELFSIIVTKAPLESKDWVLDVLYGVCVQRFCVISRVDSVSQNDFVQSRAGTEAKDALVKAVYGYANIFLA